MKESKLNYIKSNNHIINSLIKKIINSNSEEAFIINKNGNYDISDIYRQMLELEITKILKIYHLEFPNLLYNDKRKIDIRIFEGNHIDANFSDNAVQFSLRIKSGFEELRNGKLDGDEYGYNISEDGQITYNPNGLTEKLTTNLIDKGDGTPYILKSNETVENDFDEKTSFLYYYLNDSKYETELFSVLPHEMAHAFGFNGGIFEGLTENVSREVSKKYGLTNSPFARKDFVQLIQKIEKSIGRDKLVEHAHTFGDSKERIDIISQLIDEKVNPDKKDNFKSFYDTYTKGDEYGDKLEEELNEKFKKGEITEEEFSQAFRSNPVLKKFKAAQNEYATNLIKDLDSYIQNHPNALFNLGETDMIGNDKDFDDVISFQLSEIETLNKILEKVKEQNLKRNNNFRSSLQSMVNDTISYNTSKDNTITQKDEPELKKDISL